MRKRKIKRAIEKGINYIKKYATKIPLPNDKEAIHEMRLGYKKLRALIRIINQQPGNAKKIEIPSKLKDAYRLAGTVRDLQLYHESITAFLSQNESYLHWITKKIQQEKIYLLHSLAELNYRKLRKQLQKNLPDQLDDTTLQKFISEKIVQGCKLVKPKMPDTDLHTLRKYFKDINYNLKLFKEKIEDRLPLKYKKDIVLFNKLPEALSTHQDYAVKIAILNKTTPEDPSLLEILRKIGRQWHQKKQTLKKTILKRSDAFFTVPVCAMG